MVPGAIGLVVGGGPFTQYASPTTMLVPGKVVISISVFSKSKTDITYIVNFYEQRKFTPKSGI